MIPGNFGKGGGYFHFTFDQGYLILVEYFRQQLLQHLVGYRRELRHLDHGAVTGGQCGHQRQQCQLNRVIPRHHNANHAQWLVHHMVV